jgi:ATP-dependent protease ClpP protease subunit
MSDPWWSVASRRPERLVLKIGGGLIAEDTADLIALIRLAREPEILIRIDSRGGDALSTEAVAAELERHPAHVVVRIEGEAYSAALRLACAANQVHAVPDATLMMHGPRIDQGGTARVLRIWADRLDTLSRDYAAMLSRKTGKPVEHFIPLLLDGEDHYLSALEARAMGLVDVILSEGDA